MLLFYIRHGEPVYKPDSLTPNGELQAEAIGRRLAKYGVDRVFSSTSNRAIQTARPTCRLLNKELTQLEFCRERHSFDAVAIENEQGKRGWMFENDRCRRLFTDPSVLSLGSNWYEHPAFGENQIGEKLERIYHQADDFLRELGYDHERGVGRYKVLRSNRERVALFAHQGFGLLFMSFLLDIPFPQFCNHFDLCHSSMTVIDFQEIGEYAIPKLLTVSNDGHLYHEQLSRQVYPEF